MVSIMTTVYRPGHRTAGKKTKTKNNNVQLQLATLAYNLVVIREQVDVEHVGRLNVHHQVPGVGEGRFARDAVKPFRLRFAAAAATVVVVVAAAGGG